MENEPDPKRWENRSRDLTVVWTAIRAPLLFILGTLLLVFLSVAWYLGHEIPPYLIMVDVGLFGTPMFFLSQGGPKP